MYTHTTHTHTNMYTLVHTHAGRAWLDIGGVDIECTKATFGHFRSLRASLRWAEPAQAHGMLTNGEAINGCVAVVKRDPPNLHEQRTSHVEKVGGGVWGVGVGVGVGEGVGECMRVCVCVCVCACVRVCIYLYVYANPHTHTCTNTHLYG